ncbi:MAG: SHOCT domain-containing protein [Acidimicrobiia bacterium]
MDSFLDFFWLMLYAFIWIIWIMLLFRVFADIFRSDSSGWAKAGWVIFVIILPFLGVLVYLIAQGGNMAKREVATAVEMDQAQREYIRDAAGSSAGVADELERLSGLKDRGVLTETEFETQKAKLLA